MKISRDQFLQSIGAHSTNKYWSWSAVNQEKKWVIFGAWDVHTKNGREMILSNDWRYNKKGKKQPGYTDAFRNLRLVEDENYKLKTYSMILEETGDGDVSRAKIKDFIPILHDRNLIKSGNSWYAVDENSEPTLFPDEEPIETESNNTPYKEGMKKKITVNGYYERSAQARKSCIEHHGCFCSVCNLDFIQLYGDLGKDFIHVHHLKPISQIKEEYKIDPVKDLIPVCPNCHAMIHQTNPIKNIDEMRVIVEIGRRNIKAGVFKNTNK